ncbi:hypothetical protein FA95DRAFT_1628721 [Auriscalpium vulgare]|uniref:Uncharacterized protein n=1 Tax=Auriscalpium vulgare TaxID=40419 RepID=A0ACB8RHU0_9AGAM|nr:hypothetical protein FA95DRAFT_1628721 [Auriscalpium vulgare]
MPPYQWNEQEPWNSETLRGSVYEVPNTILDIVVSRCHAQWLSSFEPGDKEVSKNHMTWRLVFEDVYHVGASSLFAALLSMEPNTNASEDDTFTNLEPGLLCGRHFAPGVFTLKMLNYDTPTYSTVFSREYPLAAGITLGRFIETITERNMDKFLFNIYTYRKFYKGCGHFAVRAYEVWFDEGLITSLNAVQDPYKTFPEDIVHTYHPNGNHIHARVGLGRFLWSDPRFDRHSPRAPETMWSNGIPLWMHIVALHDIEAENRAAAAAALQAEAAAVDEAEEGLFIL